MTLYKATKNLVFTSLDQSAIVDEVIELDPEYAKKVNEDLKLTFPDVAAVLVLADGDESVEDKPADEDKLKKPGRKKVDAKASEDAAE
ncbi:hypothetical protein [Streptococcus cristatus]|uniref:Uncharacterized protein n=1 Tax=Streptococcus cristatus TaxID=45634 RepID=A0A139N1W4_STRCR|nr:hypothetical protein [Streptococcus cristatus]KXT70000.1 hypothetical protein SCRDD08_00939 [Streptococcus cristatus]QBX13964.1 hypothetical protein Javan115_0036 [Streptococcus phage Javan115]